MMMDEISSNTKWMQMVQKLSILNDQDLILKMYHKKRNQELGLFRVLKLDLCYSII